MTRSRKPSRSPQTGRNRKKALLIISDGNDSSSYTKIDELKRLIRESEVLVYAIGIDSMTQTSRRDSPGSRASSSSAGRRRSRSRCPAAGAHRR